MAARRDQSVAKVLGTGVVVALIGAAVVWPVLGVVASVKFGVTVAWGVDVGLLLRSFGVAALIAAMSVILALPGAWVMRGPRRGWGLLLAAPMLLPAYLAYTGWGVLRAPDTALGRWLMMGPRGVAGPSDSANWYPEAAGYVLAVAGLALWAWPVAAVMIGVRLGRVDTGVFESLKMDVRRPWRRAVEVLSLCRGAMASAFGVVALVMLGSAIPLHLAQLDTYAIRVWRLLDQTPRGEQWRAWVVAWPLLAIAAGGAVVIGRRLLGVDAEEVGVGRGGGSRRVASVASGFVWGVSIVVPVVMLAVNVRNWGAAGIFLRLVRGPLVASAMVSVMVGGAVAFLACWTWMVLSGRSRRLGILVGGMLLGAGLAPGILIGAATARAWAFPGVAWVGDTWMVVALAHVARFGMVGVVAGWWLAATENRWLRDLRKIEGGSIRGWVEGALWPRWGVVAAAGVGAGFLSFHEIESTVMVQPPSSMGGSFSWQMLQWLHFSRMDELAMGVLVIVGLGVAAGVVVAIGLGLAARNWA